MHVEAWEAMHTLLTAFTREKADVLDVGSYDVNGNYREMIERHAGWHYTGLDVCAGPNVDVVSADPYHFPFEDNTFDLLISGSTMEHVEAIWLWVPELVRVLKPGGMLSIVTHWSFKEHKYPIDCWRIMPDGMKYLFDQTGKLEQVQHRDRVAVRHRRESMEGAGFGGRTRWSAPTGDGAPCIRF